MSCPEKISVTIGDITRKLCQENYLFWKERLSDFSDSEKLNKDLLLSRNVLPAHTSRYSYLKSIFGYDEKTKKFNADCVGILSKKTRSEFEREKGFIFGVADENMTTSVKLGHDIFVFAYHGIHNPYHRQTDPPPQQPIGYFIKKTIENFGCVHGTPCDVSDSNKRVDDYRIDKLEKFYLLANDLREYKPYEIRQEDYLGDDFWFYFGSPYHWENEDYGKRLYEYQGEFRYFNSINPEDIEAILWPIWTSSVSTPMDQNWDLMAEFKETFPSIKVIEYNLKSHGNRWAMALVEASYYSQKHYLINNYFHRNASIAKQIVEEYESTH
jgi:hypothetical protein